MFKFIKKLFVGAVKLDPATLETLETQLLLADVGIETTTAMLAALKTAAQQKQLTRGDLLQQELQRIMVEMLLPCQQPWLIPATTQPFVILMIGVNGAGKTTTIGKLAKQFKAQGKSVLLAAGDTFRAAAIEQLLTWGQRNAVPVIAQQQHADSASVIFDALHAATARKIDILLADTAGRLHTQAGLMAELAKIKRVMQKIDATAPHETLLVLDASLGQNALQQAKQFHAALGVTGIVMTKLDGTAKVGILFAVAAALHLPIRFIGNGEKADDLQPFDAQTMVTRLFAD